MAAVLSDRTRLAALATFIDRVTGAVLVYANTVGGESPASMNANRARVRTGLIAQVLNNPSTIGTQFARAAAGSSLADTFANSAGGTDDVKQAAITDAQIASYVAGAWEIIAGVSPAERGA